MRAIVASNKKENLKMPVTQATITNLQDIFRRIDLQLKTSDEYAKRNKSKTDLLPSVWEIQNIHIRDLLNECKEILEVDSKI